MRFFRILSSALSVQQPGYTSWSFSCADFSSPPPPPLQVAKGPVVLGVMTNGIRIIDAADQQQAAAGPADAMMEADEEFARKLQAKMAAQEHAGGGR